MRATLRAILAGACLLSAGLVHGGEAVGEVQLAPGALTVFPSVPYAQLELTVSGPGVYWRGQYEPGQTVAFLPAQAGVLALPDGKYKYELIASPALDEEAWARAEDDKAALAALEKAELEHTHRQFGRFQVVSGVMVEARDPDSVVPEER